MSEEERALKILELSKPTNFAAIKSQFRILAKKYHPDVNKGSHRASEYLKTINAAYEHLTAIYKKQ
jgi:DnaJ-class molecular chaperone